MKPNKGTMQKRTYVAKSTVETTDAPKTLSDLLEKARVALWRNKGCEAMFVSNVKQSIEFLGENLEVTTDGIDQYKALLEEHGLKPATVNQKLTNLHTVLSFGHDRGWIKDVPKFSLNKLRNNRTRVCSKEEEEAILSFLRFKRKYEEAAFIELLILTGCRRGELLSATQDNLDGSWLRLWETKTGIERSIPLTTRAKELAYEFIPFTIPEHTLHRAFKMAKRECGIDDSLVLHSLRHTAATRLLKKTQNIAMVQQLLGHTDIRMTTRYAHIESDDFFNAVTSGED